MDKKRILLVGDGVTPTGFSTVLTNIAKNLPKDKYDIHHLAINYFGDPHEYSWKIYPAALGGDIWGFGRIGEMINKNFDMILILNDVWVIDKYLEKLKELNTKLPPIAAYFPIDSKELSLDWFKHFDIVTSTNVYTQFAKDEILKVKDDLLVNIIPHGVDNKTFYKLGDSTKTTKKILYPDREDFIDSFIVLSAHRNQPRKRLDLTLEGFALFAEKKPENVKLYMHCGLKDMGVDIIRLSYRYSIDMRMVITNTNQGTQRVPEERLNLIYNACDVGIATSVGEGWSLTNHEHAATGAVQVVPSHSACKELYEDCGLLIPTYMKLTNHDTLTVSEFVRPEDVATSLETLYKDEKLLKSLSDKCYKKFSSKKYSWEYIVDKYWTPLFAEIIDD